MNDHKQSSPNNNPTTSQLVTFPALGSIQRASPSSDPSKIQASSPQSSPFKKPRAKVVLDAGFSPLDWANLKKTQATEHFTVFTINVLLMLTDLKGSSRFQ
jgi:hypothetical protein